MRIKNNTKKTAVAEDIIYARSEKDRLLGLTQYTTPRAMMFKTRWGIHTFGMRFPIDVIVCDATLRVRAIRKNLTPNHIFFWNPRWGYVLELPQGTIQKSEVECGDLLVREE